VARYRLRTQAEVDVLLDALREFRARPAQAGPHKYWQA